MTLLFHAVRRGLEHSSAAGLVKRAAENDFDFDDLLNWGGAVVFFTFILFIVVTCAVCRIASSVPAVDSHS
jgi:hypothetical protein